MAVVDRSGKVVGSETTGTNLVGATVQLNLEEDAWARTAPPPKGRYKLRIFLGKVSAPLECKIVSDNADFDGITIFAGVSTRMFRGRNISTMVGMIEWGIKVSEKGETK